MFKRPRRLPAGEIDALLALDVPARLAGKDRGGFPHITPLWFIWHDSAFHMTRIVDRPHLVRLAHDPRAGLCVDTEDPERNDGQRPNRQVRATGIAELFPDSGGAWTTRITNKYVCGPAAARSAASRAADERVVICLRPTRLAAVASV